MVGNSSLISDLVDDVESVCFSIFKKESDSMFDQLFFRSEAFCLRNRDATKLPLIERRELLKTQRRR